MAKSNLGTLHKVLEKQAGGMYFIQLSPKEVEPFLKNGNKRVICWINEQEAVHVALLPVQQGQFYWIRLGAAWCKKLKLRTGSTLTIRLKSDDTPHQFDVPEEWTEVMATDPEAEAVFQSLTPGNQRSLLYLVLKMRSTDKRIEKSLMIAEKLKWGITSPREMVKKN